MNFEKTTKQEEATRLLSSKAKHVMLYGGSRSGKTFILCYALIVRACRVKSRHVVLRFKFNHVKTSVFLDTFPKVLSLCFPDCGAKPDKTDYLYRFPNGSEIWFGGLDEKERTEKILGKEYSTMYFNESSQLSYSAVLMAKTRLAEKNDLKKKLYFDCNPPTKSSWVYWLWERHHDPLAEEPVAKEDYVSLLMNPTDNIDNLDPEYVAMLDKLPEKERNRFLLGLFAESDDGQAYYQFNRDKHVGEVSKYQGTVFIGMDFNVDPLTAVAFQVVNGQFHVIDEFFLRNSDTYRMVKELVTRGYRGAQIIPDSTAKNRKTSGKSDVVILQEAGFQVLPTRNPFVNDRVNNVNRLLNQNRVIVSPKCKKLINDLEKVSWKDNKLNQKDDKMLTHISDAFSYGLWKLEPLNGDTGGAGIRLY